VRGQAAASGSALQRLNLSLWIASGPRLWIDGRGKSPGPLARAETADDILEPLAAYRVRIAGRRRRGIRFGAKIFHKIRKTLHPISTSMKHCDVLAGQLKISPG